MQLAGNIPLDLANSILWLKFISGDLHKIRSTLRLLLTKISYDLLTVFKIYVQNYSL